MMVGPGVEGEAVLAIDVGAAAGRVELLQHGDPVAPRAEPDRGGQAAEAAADDHRMRLAGSKERRRRLMLHGSSSGVGYRVLAEFAAARALQDEGGSTWRRVLLMGEVAEAAQHLHGRIRQPVAHLEDDVGKHRLVVAADEQQRRGGEPPEIPLEGLPGPSSPSCRARRRRGRALRKRRR